MINQIKKLALTSRPISWVNTAFPFAAGYIMTQHKFNLILLVGTLFYLIPYNLLMYGINDVFDFESDQLNPRKGGAEGAKLSRLNHKMILITSISLPIPFLIYLFYVSNFPYGSLVLIVNLFLVIAYSLPKLRFKERAFIDSMTSSSHFFGPLVFALSFSPFRLSYLYVILSFFFWGMASHAFGAVQDIIPDRQAHIGSVATIIGAKKTVYLAVIFYIISGAILLLVGFNLPVILISICSLFYVVNIWPYLNVNDESAEKSNFAWKRFIKINWLTGFIVTMVLIYLYHH